MPNHKYKLKVLESIKIAYKIYTKKNKNSVIPFERSTITNMDFLYIRYI